MGTEATEEELEQIYRLMLKGLPNGEIKEEMRDFEFPLRNDVRFFRQRRREINAAKKVLLADVTQTHLDPLVAKARKDHIKDLIRVAKEWKDWLGVYVEGPNYFWNCIVPNTFSEQDGKLGPHGPNDKAPLEWDVTENGEVNVWLGIERREVLFQPLVEHLPTDVKNAYDSLKLILVEGILKGSGKPDNDIYRLAGSMSRHLELIIAARYISGTCAVCRGMGTGAVQETKKSPVSEVAPA